MKDLNQKTTTIEVGINNGFEAQAYKILTTPTIPAIPRIIDGKLSWSKEFVDFIALMKIALKNKENGVALAANQVWSDPNAPCPRVFVLWNEDHTEIEEYINPTVKGTGKTLKLEEACLSFVGFVTRKSRAKNATVTYQKLDSPELMNSVKYSGLHSQAVQHEVDHLDGKTIKKINHG